jgi:pyruvate/2-oxoglutarate/acetoin dehydrogenase E1 component
MRVIEAINKAIHDSLEESPKVIMLGEDVCDPYGGAFKASRGLSTKFPGRVINTPISEAGFVGLAAGLAIGGFRPVVEIMFGDFILVAADQIINHISKYRWMYNDQVSVPMVIRAPMGGRRGYGPTHSQSLERYFLGTPGLNVIALSHVNDPYSVLKRAILECKDPTLVIENKTIYPKKLLEPGEWKIKKLLNSTVITLGNFYESNLTIITYGGMTKLAMEASEVVFKENNIITEIVDLTSLQPLRVEEVSDYTERSGKALILEEGVEFYGVGAEISCRLNCKSYRVGALDLPIGNSTDLEDIILPNTNRIVKTIRRICGI